MTTIRPIPPSDQHINQVTLSTQTCHKEVFGIGATTLDACSEEGGSATFKMYNYILDSHLAQNVKKYS